jgi:hypothetical protein
VGVDERPELGNGVLGAAELEVLHGEPVTRKRIAGLLGQDSLENV